MVHAAIDAKWAQQGHTLSGVVFPTLSPTLLIPVDVQPHNFAELLAGLLALHGSCMTHAGGSCEAVTVRYCNVCTQACTRHVSRLDAAVE